jgi:4-amino-4-deoxy-L-arabinose transferase-like glycosyltransferase
MLHNNQWVRRMRLILSHPIFHLCLVLVVYGALLLPTVGRQGISWDEQTDIRIARAYVSPYRGWFGGSFVDPSQTRLPMAAVAIVYAFFGTQDLFTARVVSCLVGALTLVGIYVYCRRDYNHRTGLLACGLLATSPFFLSFARVAFTETDVYVACAFAWLLVCMSQLREKGTIGWAFAVAIVFGLAISAKFTAVTVLPAVVIEILAHSGTKPEALRLTRSGLITAAILLSLASMSVLGVLAAVHLVGTSEDSAPLFYVQPVLWWLAALIWAVCHCRQTVKPLAIILGVVVLALLTFILFPPVHLTNRAILDALAGRFQNEMEYSLSFMVEAAALHIMCVLFKSSPLIGLGLLVAPVAALFRWSRQRERRVLRFPLLLLLTYFAGLVILPIAQTFYIIPLLPIFAVLGASQFFRLLAGRKATAIAIGCLAAALLVLDLARCYPDYNLNGYQYLGNRFLFGRSSIGYRSVVQVPSDGVEQLARWIKHNVQPGQRVLACINPWHIVNAISPGPSFALDDIREQSISPRPDFVIVHINCEIRQGWGRDNPRGRNVFQRPYDKAWLEANYDRIGIVSRAFGIEVASVWKRK